MSQPIKTPLQLDRHKTLDPNSFTDRSIPREGRLWSHVNVAVLKNVNVTLSYWLYKVTVD